MPTKRRRFGRRQAAIHTYVTAQAVKRLDTLLIEADQSQVWKALGYESREAWLKAEVPSLAPREVWQ